MFGREFAIEAEVVQLTAFSGHADVGEILDWMRHADRPPQMTYLTHGEPSASDTLRWRVQDELSWKVRSPEHLETVNLDRPR